MSEPTICEWAGGAQAIARWLDTFYDLVERDGVLSPVVGGTVGREQRDRVTAWWCDTAAGPPSLEQMLGGRPITVEQRGRVVALLSRAADVAGLPADPGFRSALLPVAESAPEDPMGALNVGMAAERTWLAWWRTALVATAGALGVGRLAPVLLDAAPATYIVLGCLYAVLAIALLAIGARRQQRLQAAIDRGEPAPLPFRVIVMLTVGGVLLTVFTVVVVLAQL
jgi:hemoglobin